jgi:4-amino-4-deoxy-L-arabinose transferase-like glycosyltransferase
MRVRNLYMKHIWYANYARIRWAVFFGVAIVSFIVVYGQSFGFFFWQDDFNLLEFVKTKSLLDYIQISFVKPDKVLPLNLGVVFRPIPHYIYFKISYLLFGLDPVPYRLINAALFLVSSVLVVKYVQIVTDRSIAGFLAGVLFVINRSYFTPLYWISDNNEILFVFFALISILAYMYASEKRGRVWIYLTISHVGFLLALLSKETAIVLPALIAFSLFFRMDNRRIYNKLRDCLALWPQIIMIVAFLLLRAPLVLYALKGGGGSYYTTSKFANIPINLLWGFWWNIETFVEPYRVTLDRITRTFSLFQPIYLSILIVGMICAIAIWLMRASRSALAANPIWLGLAWFIISASPALVTGILVDYIFAMSAIGFVLIVAYILEMTLSIVIRDMAKVRIVLTIFAVMGVLSAHMVIATLEKTTWPVRYMPQALETIEFAQSQTLDKAAGQTVCLVGFSAETWWPGRSQAAFNVFVDPDIRVVDLTAEEFTDDKCPSEAYTFWYADDGIVLTQPSKR